MLSIGLLLIWIPYGSDFILPVRRLLSVFFGRWPFLELLVVY